MQTQMQTFFHFCITLKKCKSHNHCREFVAKFLLNQVENSYCSNGIRICFQCACRVTDFHLILPLVLVALCSVWFSD